MTEQKPGIKLAGRTPQDPQVGLADQVAALLPTPSAGAFNDSESPESWQARAGTLREKHGNGNGAGTPLAVAVKLLPTPDAANALGGHHSRGGDRSDELLLPGLVKTFLPTPTVGDSKSARNSTAKRNRTPPTGVHDGDTLTDAVSLLPTPKTSDADRGGDPERYKGSKSMNGRRSNLVDAAMHFLPGDPTSQPSGAGKASSDALPLPQPTREDG